MFNQSLDLKTANIFFYIAIRLVLDFEILDRCILLIHHTKSSIVDLITNLEFYNEIFNLNGSTIGNYPQYKYMTKLNKSNNYSNR